MARQLNNFLLWPADAPEEMPVADVIRMYEQGFAGTWQDDEARERLESLIASQGPLYGEDIAHQEGFAESGKGKLVMPFLHVVEAYPGCFPGPAQGRGDCVSHDQKNSILVSTVGDVVTGTPDEETGQPEGLPEVSAEGISQGVFATEPIYWYRGHGGDGWQCDEACEVTMKDSGLWIRKDYPELGFNLTRYSARTAGNYGSRRPPENITAEGRKHLVRRTAICREYEAIRDFMFQLYGISTCGSEGIEDKRDANGVSRRRSNWAHAMSWTACDDREIAHKTYGEALFLDQNSWNVWNSGPRDIMDSASLVPPEKKQRWIEIGLVNPATGNIMIPEGSCWVRWSEFKRRQILAKSSVNGFPARRPNNLLI
jgi:hypothetical protein